MLKRESVLRRFSKEGAVAAYNGLQHMDKMQQEGPGDVAEQR